MKTIPTSLLIKDSIDGIAILDADLRIINYSDIFLKNYVDHQANVAGERFLDILPNIPKALRQALLSCLDGKITETTETKFTSSNGQTGWLKWKLHPLKDDLDQINGIVVILEDITESKRYNELLLRAENVSRTGSWEMDLIKNKIFWSPMTKAIHEVAPDYVPTLETGINFYKEGHYRNLITQLVNDAIEQGKSWDTELIIITQKGKELWVRAKGESEIINDTCIRVSGTFQDIDAQKKRDIEAQKKSELKHKETANLLKIATNTAKIGIWEYHITENELIWDDNMYTLYGVEKENFSGVYEAWEAAIHPDDKVKGNKDITLAISGEKEFDTDFRVVWPDGAIRFIKAIASTERDENGVGLKMVGANWDITELKNTQLELERNTESFLHTFTNSTIGMALVGLDGKWLRVNKTLCESFGYNEKELSKITYKEITHEDDIAAGDELLQEILEGKRDSYQLEKRYYHKNGGLVYAIVSVTVVRDIYGNISHFVEQVMDITLRMDTEKKLKAVLEVTDTQNKSLLNFAHIVSHNLRSHSTNMSMLIKFLLNEKDPEEQKNINTMLIDATNSLSETIDHLNDVVHVKTDTLKKMKAVNVLNTLKNVQTSIQGLINTQEANIILNVDKNHQVKVVPAYLESIFLNLYTNALKYASPKRKPILNITTVLNNDTVLISFSDNGLGIDLKRHGDKLFGMYKTFHKHKEAKGIGLFITKNQIDAMNGTITVESTLDQGTTFFLRFKKG